MIEHIKGEDNIWAGMMTRWGAAVSAEVSAVHAVRKVTAQVPDYMRVRPLQRADFVWPTVDDIKDRQKHLSYNGELMIRTEDGLLTNKKGKILVPDDDTELKMRLCVIAHSGGNSGHLGYKATVQKLTQYFYWKNCVDDVRQICKAC